MTDRQIDEVKYTTPKAARTKKQQAGAKNNRSKSTTSPAVIKPAKK
jgi:hypothetical protein